PEDLDYTLPAEQIAQQPAARRGDAKMLVLRGGGAPVHSQARELPQHLPQGALVVVNDSRVVPARLYLERERDGRTFEALVCDPAPGLRAGHGFRAWVRGAKRLKEGERLRAGDFACRFVGADPIDPRARRFEVEAGELLSVLEAQGEIPLPPYIRREGAPGAGDRERYQTIYARDPGSVAAPTAGLHWEPELLETLDLAPITLHVGPGTFLPMDVEDVRDHRVGAERYTIPEASAAKIRAAKAAGRPLVAVGTTATRALEAVAAANDGAIVAGSGSTDLVITPGHDFRAVDLLVTNFHLPRSSLLMLVTAFGGHARVMAAYREAVAAGYRFYSYGDCMLLDRG
ncbi:MAG: tRNA preQ1(34) S-adenosylmethionine ribosyltransferase-isomerase QueA, partial [Myxococcales bacterium]|nr:tRNA preQ1(34) S-adenosylmethionine ribosyltransferase-isomerase QueA [Myxococcales bacterium]